MGDEHRTGGNLSPVGPLFGGHRPRVAEPLAGQLTRTTYAEPHWSGSRGSAVATARVLLYGLPIVQDRAVQWGRINPLEARDFLIRQGLVEGDIQSAFSTTTSVGQKPRHSRGCRR